MGGSWHRRGKGCCCFHVVLEILVGPHGGLRGHGVNARGGSF